MSRPATPPSDDLNPGRPRVTGIVVENLVRRSDGEWRSTYTYVIGKDPR